MSNESSRRVRLVFGIILSIALAVAGVCLMIACLNIYLSGGKGNFTTETVGHAFSQIAVPVYLCLALVVVGFVLDLFLPLGKNKLKAEKNPAATLERLMSKRDLNICDPALNAQILALRKGRNRDKLITLVILGVCSIVFLCYSVKPANFHDELINTSVIKATVILLVCMAIPFALALATVYRAKKSLEKEIELVKQIPAGETVPQTTKKDPVKWITALRWALVVLAVAVLVYGFYTGGPAYVLAKAKAICTECIGLG